MQRGEIWRYAAKGPRGPRPVLIVSSDGINDDGRRPWVIGVELTDTDPRDLVAVAVPGHGWADASTVVRLFRRWMEEPIDTLDAPTMERVDVALRAVLDL